MSQVVQLREWESCEVALSPEAARLLADVAGHRLGVAVGSSPGTWLVTGTSHVGAYVTPDLELLVHPKVPMHNLFMMLDVGIPGGVFDEQTFAFASERSLLASLAQLFARSVERAVGNGLMRSYRFQSEPLMTLRGRINVGLAVRRPGLSMPVPCDFEEYTADVFENRVLRAALVLLLRVPGIRPVTRRHLSHALGRFEEVSDVAVDVRALDRVVYTRLNRHYQAPLRLAGLILRNLSLIDRIGTADASAFTVDMNALFQDWVTDRLARHLRGRLGVVAERTEHLGAGRKVPMYPDLELWAGNNLVYVGDVKYKLTGTGLARNADYYQLLAYATALDLPEGLLIYCQADGKVPDREIEVRFSGKRLCTHALTLSGSPADAEAALATLADVLAERVDASLAHVGAVDGTA
jgi:5-methylcytosine-specific restriction enzyme subunit McrC